MTSWFQIYFHGVDVTPIVENLVKWLSEQAVKFIFGSLIVELSDKIKQDFENFLIEKMEIPRKTGENEMGYLLKEKKRS